MSLFVLTYNIHKTYEEGLDSKFFSFAMAFGDFFIFGIP